VGVAEAGAAAPSPDDPGRQVRAEAPATSSSSVTVGSHTPGTLPDETTAVRERWRTPGETRRVHLSRSSAPARRAGDRAGSGRRSRRGRVRDRVQPARQVLEDLERLRSSPSHFMKILFLSSEVVPWSKTGGLADVSGALPAALRSPRPQSPDDHAALRLDRRRAVADPDPNWGLVPPLAGQDWTFTVYSDPGPAHAVPRRARDSSTGSRCTPTTRRAPALGRVPAPGAANTIAAGFKPKIIHCNDWQTGLVPLLTKTRLPGLSDVPTLLTIHNLGYQGRSTPTPSGISTSTDQSLLHQDHLAEGWYSLLETGLLHTDWISTVSPTYAREIQTPEGGAGLDPMLRRRSDRVVGILNGIDTDRVESEHRPPHPVAVLVAVPVAQGTQQGSPPRRTGTALPPHVPVLGVVSRLASQKGFDIMGAPLIHFLESWDVRLAVLGSGEARYERFFRSLPR
jgi:starch synthase